MICQSPLENKVPCYCCLVTQSCLTLCNPMDCSMPGFPVLPGVCSNSCPLSRWCQPTILTSVVPFSSCFQPFPASGSFLMSQFFALGGQSNAGASASALVPSLNIQDWFPLGLTCLISLQSQGLSRVFSNTIGLEASVFWCLASFMVQLSHPYMTTGKTKALTIWNFVGKVMSLLFNMLSRFVIAFLPRSKRLLVSWLQSPSAVIFIHSTGIIFTIFVHWSCCLEQCLAQNKYTVNTC